MSLWFRLTHASSTQNITTVLQYPEHAQQIAKSTADHIAQIDNYYLPLVEKVLDGDPEITYDSPFWRVRAPLQNIDRIQAPTLVTGALNDIFQRDAPLIYEALKDRVDSRLMVFNGDHFGSFLQAIPGTEKTDPLLHLVLQWFDHYLKGMDTDLESIPPVTQYVKHYKWGTWQGFDVSTDWPHPAAMPERWYLHGDMSLTRQMPEQETPGHSMDTPLFLEYLYGKNDLGGLLRLKVTLQDGTQCSPSYVQWTLGTAGWFLPLPCFWNNARLERDALNYETSPMTEDYYINGSLQADLWITSTVTEAALSVRIDEVSPGGQVNPITNGLQLASMRRVDPTRSRYLQGEMIQPFHPFTQEVEEFLQPGVPTLVQVEIFPTAALIRQGHKLRVSISPSNQAQGGVNLPRRERARGGVTTILNSPQYPSSVILPVVPVAELD